MDDLLKEALEKYGDRSNSWITSYPEFKHFDSESGIVRYTETQKSIVAASEPLAPNHLRHKCLKDISEFAQTQKKNSVVIPISETLASELESSGFDTIPIGSEPVFELNEYFSRMNDPLQSFSSAKAMRAKGYEVEEKNSGELTLDEVNSMRILYSEWKEKRQNNQIGFLSTINPFEAINIKKYFLLKKKTSNQIIAYITALPIKPINAMYFCDWIRPIITKSGMMEFLLIESMRILWKNNYSEVRLGMAPLSHLNQDDFKGIRKKFFYQVMNLVFDKVKSPYSFQGLFQFKAKLEPTRWDKLYLASSKKISFSTFLELNRIHFSNQATGAIDRFFQKLVKSYFTNLSTVELPKNIFELIYKLKFSIFGTTLMLVIHIFAHSKSGDSYYLRSGGFIASNFNLEGFITGPILHDHTYHLLGDLSTFLLIGGLVELLLGTKLWALATVLGFWSTNLISIFILKLMNTFGFLSNENLTKAFSEHDYGSSNAIYAFAGLLAMYTPKPVLTILPFAINGLAVCIGKSSLLAIHHWVGLLVGITLAKVFSNQRS